MIFISILCKRRFIGTSALLLIDSQALCTLMGRHLDGGSLAPLWPAGLLLSLTMLAELSQQRAANLHHGFEPVLQLRHGLSTWRSCTLSLAAAIASTTRHASKHFIVARRTFQLATGRQQCCGSSFSKRLIMMKSNRWTSRGCQLTQIRRRSRMRSSAMASSLHPQTEEATLRRMH